MDDRPKSKAERKREKKNEELQLKRQWEEFTQEQVKKFSENTDTTILSFPPSLSSTQRKFIHNHALSMGLHSLSEGNGNNRHIVLLKEPLVQHKTLTLETLDTQLRRDFCTNYRIPINVFQSPYFEYYFELLDELFQTKLKMEWFLRLLNNIGGTHTALLEYCGKLKGMVESTIKSQPIYEQFNADPLEEYQPWDTGSLINKDMYEPHHSGKYFISLDLISANFNALYLYNPNLVLNTTSWEELLGKFTQEPFLLKNKKYRQVILSHLNGLGQKKIWESIIRRIYTQLVEQEIIDPSMVVCTYTDEVVIQTSEELMISQMKILKNYISEQNIKFLKVDLFKLIQIHPSKKGFVKLVFPNIDDLSITTVQFKHVPMEKFALFYKKYYGLETNDMDRTWYQTTYGMQLVDEATFWS